MPSHQTGRGFCGASAKSSAGAALPPRGRACGRVGAKARIGSCRRRSDPAEQHENDNDDQDGADKTDAAVTVAVAVAAETAAETAEQEDDEDDDEYKSDRHGLISVAIANFKLRTPCYFITTVISMRPPCQNRSPERRTAAPDRNYTNIDRTLNAIRNDDSRYR